MPGMNEHEACGLAAHLGLFHSCVGMPDQVLLLLKYWNLCCLGGRPKTELLACDFFLVKPWLLLAFGEWTSRWAIPISFFLHHLLLPCPSLSFKCKKKKKGFFEYSVARKKEDIMKYFSSNPKIGQIIENWLFYHIKSITWEYLNAYHWW